MLSLHRIHEHKAPFHKQFSAQAFKVYSLCQSMWETHSQSAHSHCLWALFSSAHLLVIHNYSNKWLQACGSNVCGHEVIWKTGADPPEGHHWKPRWILFLQMKKRYVNDAVNMSLHYVLQHLDRPGAYVRIVFVDFSSVFNTIIPNLRLPKLTQLSVPTSICQWINSFLTDRQAAAASEAGKIHIQHPYDQPWSSSGLCSLPTALLSLYTNDCTI